MRKPVTFVKTALDLLSVQLTWTFGAIGVMLLINVARVFFAGSVDSFYSAAFIAGNIYMLVIGIIAIHFLPFFVELGVTRRNYFVGGMIASIALSIVIPVVSYIISLFQKLIANNVSSFILRENTLEDNFVNTDGHMLGDVIQSIILTPYIKPESHLVLSLALFSLHIFVFYLIGWLIGAAFYRLNVVGGLIFVVISLGFMTLKDTMIRLTLNLPTFKSFLLFQNVPEVFASPLVFITVIAIIFLIHLLTKRAPIKI